MQNGVVLYIIFLLCEHTIYRFSKHILVNSDEYGTFVHQLIYNSFQGYSNLSLFFFLQSFFLFFFTACSTNTSTQCCFLKSRIKVGSQSSLAIPKSLQHRIRALDLQASVAVAIPDGSKYSCSPRATDTNRPRHTKPHSLLTILGPTSVSPRGAKPHPPGPNAAFNVRLYFISGRYNNPSGLISTSAGVNGFNSSSAASLGNGFSLKPEKLVLQSNPTGASPASLLPILAEVAAEGRGS